jgi:hypothetical protein
VSELNPNHAVTTAVREQWSTIAALIMHKLGRAHVVLTVDDLNAIAADPQAIVVQEKRDGLHLRLVSMEEGERLARMAGGLPQ